ncbi:hypothetical protein F5148DRAFT_1356321 [Russula earlei]|uniref:Uncharacterized protein n=1 Tax=Russula earlei TaxID=71964 RepID=A0ACC0U9F5_9AGAM|nr:hypothetical protein F5148DRAFT_1356321 [Russula earlei]
MSAYPVGGSHQYYGDSAQHGVYNDPTHFGAGNAPLPQDTYRLSGYQEPEPESEPYMDEPSYSFPRGQSTEPLGPTSKETAFYPNEPTPAPRRPMSARNLRAWRYQQGRRLWTQGSRPRCICRFFFCTVLITLFLIAIIVLCLALWIQPPNIIIGGDNNSSPVVAKGINALTDGIQIDLGLPIEVMNPNFFSVKITSVFADIIYPINNTHIGNGTISNVDLPAHANTNFTFPFTLDYTTSIDPSFAIISDLAAKCLPSPQLDLTVRYKISVSVRVFFITISPTISNPISFACPLSATDIENLAKQIGLNLPGSGS